MKKETYRMLADGEEEWRGKAHSAEEAEEKCFYHEEPASLVRYTLQVWRKNKWVTIYENASI
jgi:hypothetical protein